MSSGFSESNEQEQRALPAAPGSWPLWPWVIILLVLAGIFVWRFSKSATPVATNNGPSHPAVGTVVTEISLAPLTGDPPQIVLASLDGKLTLINFWGPWCGPCESEFPHLMELVEHFRRDDKFQFLSVSCNFDPHDMSGLAESTAQFLRQKNAGIATYADPDGKTQFALIKAANIDGYGYPATVLVDGKRIVRALWIGFQAGDERQVRHTVQTLLKAE